MFCLVFLLILTMMGSAGMETAILEQKMAGHWQDHTIALQATESALRTGEVWLLSRQSLPAPGTDGTSPVWLVDSLDTDSNNALSWWREPAVAEADWWQDHGSQVSGFDFLAQAPYYVLEQLTNEDTDALNPEGECTTQQRLYRLTARGSGVNTASIVMLQSEQEIVFECNDPGNLTGSVNLELSGRRAWRWL